MAWSERTATARATFIWGLTAAAAAPVIVFAANGTVILLGLLALAVSSLGALRLELLRLAATPVGIALIGLAGWMTVSLLWTPHPGDAAEKIVRLSLLWLAGLAAIAATRQVDGYIVRQAVWALPALVMLALLFYAIELAGSAAIIRALTGLNALELVQITDPAQREAHRLNLAYNAIGRGASLLAMFIWPAIAMLQIRAVAPWRAGGLMVITIISLLALPMAAAPVALVTGAAAWVLCYLAPRRGPHLLAGLGMLLIVAMPVAANYVGDPTLLGVEQRAVPYSWQHRTGIWRFVAQRIAQKPLTGWGFDAARYIEGGNAPYAIMLADGSEFQHPNVTLLPLHPHNGALQIWLELGAPGALLAIVLLAGLAREIAAPPAPSYPRNTRIMAATTGATCVSAITLACISFGLWQNWWQAGFWLAAALACLANRCHSAISR